MDTQGQVERPVDCRNCPQCKSRNTVALNEKFRRCKECRHVFERRQYPMVKAEKQ